MRLKFVIFLIFYIWFQGYSQQSDEPSQVRLSILTCGPGEELYTSFGHSAFRLQVPEQGIDWVYNYGTFDFNAPNFYTNFAMGRPVFTLSVSRFSNFLHSYKLENRWVKEQILNLSGQQKDELIEFLENNKQPENRDYKYDYLYDNCSTKIPEVLEKVLGEKLFFGEDHLEELFTFRELMRQKLRLNSWSSFGIDLALGSKIDQKATLRQHMFIPEYVYRQLSNTKLGNSRLISQEQTVLKQKERASNSFFPTTPLFWFIVLLVFTIVITIRDFKKGTRQKWLDSFLFCSTGIVGLLLFFLWFFTDHSASANNFNILWAFPLNLVAGFVLLRDSKLPGWLVKYVTFLIFLLIATALLWIYEVQSFPPVIIPLLLALEFRYVYLVISLRTPQPKIS